MNQAELKQIKITDLVAHPKNPRLIVREDVVTAIEATLIAEQYFREEYAIRVRPHESKFEIISGHHRVEAAKRAKLKTVPCWVRELDDETAFMDLVRSNNQGELSALEIGMHALESVSLAVNQHSKNGGLSEYALAIGKAKNTIAHCRQAAEVYVAFLACPRGHARNEESSPSKLLNMSKAMTEIHGVPSSCWPLMVSMMLEKDWSKRETVEVVKKVKEYAVPEKWQEIFLPMPDVVSKGLKSEFSSTTVKNIIDEVERIEQRILTYNVNHSDFIKSFHGWLSGGIKDYAWDVRKIIQYGKELQAKMETAAQQEKWLLGKWQDHLGTIPDNSVALLLTDPPYGMEYQSNRRQVKQDKIAGDGLGAFVETQEMLQLAYSKLAKDAHVLVFCNWQNEPQIRESVEKAGLTIKGSLIWAKNVHGMGDIKGTFAPIHERIIHAVKGSPVLYERKPDVFFADRIPADRHPTEKPVTLLRTLIEVTTAKGELVVDPFGGVASTLVAAKECGRNFWGCELKEEYYAAGSKRIQHQ